MRTKEVGIEEILVGLAGPGAKTRQVREFLEGDLIGHFEGEQKVRWDLRNHALDVAALGNR